MSPDCDWELTWSSYQSAYSHQAGQAWGAMMNQPNNSNTLNKVTTGHAQGIKLWFLPNDVNDLSGNPIDIVPRNVLKKVINLYKDKGWAPIVAPEIEFYLTKPNLDPSSPIEPTIGRTGRKVASRQAYSMTAVDEYGRVIDDIYDFAEAQGFEIDTINQEGGAGQIEINLVHGDPLKLADQVFFFKRMIREAAFKRDCFATFMAKPMQEEPGSAMHIHQSICEIDTKHNIFTNKIGEASKYFYNFLAGQQEYLPKAICLFCLLYTSPSPRDVEESRMPSSA